MAKLSICAIGLAIPWPAMSGALPWNGSNSARRRPSATLGAEIDGRRRALFEPIHGSAPDIAGKGIANPMAQMLSFAMLLRYSFAMEVEAALIEKACVNVLASGLRTADVMGPGTAKVGTSVMGDSVLRELDKLAA